MKFIIDGRLSGLNEYTKANRTNAFVGNKMKHDNQEAVKWAIRQAKLSKIDNYPIALKITWYEPNNKRDVDNIQFAAKFIQDALVEMGIVPDDSQKYINKLEHAVFVDKEFPRVEVEIIEKG